MKKLNVNDHNSYYWTVMIYSEEWKLPGNVANTVRYFKQDTISLPEYITDGYVVWE